MQCWIQLQSQCRHSCCHLSLEGSHRRVPRMSAASEIVGSLQTSRGFPGSLAGKESACSVGDLGSIPGLGRSPGGGKGYPLQYFGLENSMDCVVHEVAKSRTQLSKFLFHFCHRKPNSKRETYFNSLCCD